MRTYRWQNIDTAFLASMGLHGALVVAFLLAWKSPLPEPRPLELSVPVQIIASVPEALKAPMPAPVPAPEPALEPAPIPTPVAEPVPQPKPEPEPVPKPEPKPEPKAEKAVKPEPVKTEPVPKPAPKPVEKVTPKPAPTPQPPKPIEKVAPAPKDISKPKIDKPVAEKGLQKATEKTADSKPSDKASSSSVKPAQSAAPRPKAAVSREVNTDKVAAKTAPTPALDLDSLSQMPSAPTPSRPRLRLTGGGGSPGTASPATGPAIDALVSRLQGLWFPNCDGGRVRVDIAFTLSPAGRLVGAPEWVDRRGDSLAESAAARAVVAVKRGEPFAGLPSDLYGVPLIVTFDSLRACRAA